MSEKNNNSFEQFLNNKIKEAIQRELQHVFKELEELKKSISPLTNYKSIQYVMETYDMSKSTVYRLMKSGAIKYKVTKGGKRLIDITTVLI